MRRRGRQCFHDTFPYAGFLRIVSPYSLTTWFWRVFPSVSSGRARFTLEPRFAEADPAVEAQTEVQAQPKAAGAVNDTTVAIRTVALHPYCLVDALKERINLLLIDECSVLTLKSADLFDLDGDAILLAA